MQDYRYFVFLLNLSPSLYVVEGFALVAPESGSYSVSLLLGVTVVRFVRNESSSCSVSLRLGESCQMAIVVENCVQ